MGICVSVFQDHRLGGLQLGRQDIQLPGPNPTGTVFQ
jgi:hypothetical protein